MKSGKVNGNGGFTLIEILVATTILLVIVILASLVFQQTTGAYDTGERKVNANVVLRNVVGAISRDLASAVDSDECEDHDKDWDESSITFVAMTGRSGYDAEGNPNSKCGPPHVITYTCSKGGVTRKEVATEFVRKSGKWEERGSPATSHIYSPSKDDPDVELTFFYPNNKKPVPSLPENIYIRAQLETEGNTSAVGAGSGGRRGWGSPDEIWVGLKP